MEALLDKIQVAIETGKLEVATENVNKALEEGANPQVIISDALIKGMEVICLLYTSPSPRD